MPQLPSGGNSPSSFFPAPVEEAQRIITDEEIADRIDDVIEVVKGRIDEETRPTKQKMLGKWKEFLEGIAEKLGDEALTDEEREKASKIIKDNQPVAPGLSPS